MSYTIGDVSEALNLSREMIRYYEKCGVLRLSRDSLSNYRSYEIMDIFWLLESLQYKSRGIGIREIQAIRSDDFHLNTSEVFEEKIKLLDQEILHKTLLREKLTGLSHSLRQSFYNLGSFHVRYIPAYYSFHLVNGSGDSYDAIAIPEKIREVYMADDIPAFLDNGAVWKKDGQEWIMMIEEKYVRELGLPLYEEMSYHPAGLYLCTNADIGEIGQFNVHADEPLRAYAKEKNLSYEGDLLAMIVGRGKVDGQFRRIVEFRLLLEKEKG